MARTKGASAAWSKIDRSGQYVSPAAAELRRSPPMSGNFVAHGPGAQPVVEAPPVIGYRATAKSCAKNMEPYDLVQLLDMYFEGFSIDIAPEEFARLPGDLKRHFIPVRE